MGEAMDEVNRICHEEGIKMVQRGYKIIDERSQEDVQCGNTSCSEAAENVKTAKALLAEMVYNVFDDKTPLWVKNKFHKNGFYRMKPKRLEKYLQNTGAKLYARNLWFFQGKGINNHRLTEIREAGLLYKESEAIDAYKRMVEYRIKMIKEQRNELLRYAFFIKPIVNMFSHKAEE